ncbi:hypothetical protein KCU83_g4668, partial [Aureobasidium melanogenum]
MAVSDFSTTGTIQKSNGQLVMASCTLQKSNGQLVMASCTVQKSDGQLVNASCTVQKSDGQQKIDAPYETKDHTYKFKDHKTDAGWAWRVVVHLESDGNEDVDYPTRIFDSTVEFLDWYDSWYERLDLEDFLEDLVEDYEFGD